MSVLPQAVAEHLRVLGIPAGPITVSAALFDQRWVDIYNIPFSADEINNLKREGATKVELGIPGGGVSEFEIEELM